jgi:hypothetical protein
MEQLQAVQQVDRYVHERRVTDQIFVNWGLYYFLLSWITLGILPIVIFYRRLNRADLFTDRRAHYYNAVITATRQYAEQTGQYGAIHDDIDDLQRYTTERFEDEHKPIKAGLSLFLSFVTLGIYGYVAIYRLMRAWWQIQLTEQDFNDKLSIIWTKLGVVKYPLSFHPVHELDRHFGLHLFLTFVTLGIYGIVWDYRLHTDPEKVYPEFHSAEDSTLIALRNAPLGPGSNGSA